MPWRRLFFITILVLAATTLLGSSRTAPVLVGKQTVGAVSLEQEMSPIPFIAVDFIDSSSGFGAIALSENSTLIARSDDGGETWRLLSQLGGQVYYLDFVSQSTGYASFPNEPRSAISTLVRTRDGGETWETLDDSLPLGHWDFVSKELGWRITSEAGCCERTLEQTTDGGESWTAIDTPCDAPDGPALGIRRVQLVDESTGWILCLGRIQIGHLEKELHQTQDGGETWELVAKANFGEPATLPLGGSVSPFFLDATHGWLMNNYPGGFAVYESNDGGRAWTGLVLGSSYGVSASSMNFIDSSQGWLLGGSDLSGGSYLYATTDGGVGWEKVQASIDQASFDANCDGTTSSIDAAVILQMEAGLLAALPCEQFADANGDGRIDSVDATFVLQFEAGLLLA